MIVSACDGTEANHPDKGCDQAPEAVLDAGITFTFNPRCKVHRKARVKDDARTVAGEIAVANTVEYETVVRGLRREDRRF